MAAMDAEPIDIKGQRSAAEAYFHSLLEGMFQDADVCFAIAYGPAEKLDMQRGTKAKAYRYHSFLDGMSSVVGWPSLTVPFRIINDLPVGLILVARPHQEEDLFATAALLRDNDLILDFERPLWRQPQRG
jgi:Asp-tRNA(Asn)/Glu-tRNA(Gln) amidotransferase A subunit family amidase